MKIGIWGSYNYGNYGDDVMAIIFAKAIEKEGHTPIVYRLNSTIANNFGIKVTNSLLEFMNETEVVVIGGGGMLVSTSRIRSLINHVDKEFENDFNRLQSLLIKDSKPVIAVSIGGDGLGAKAYLSKKRSGLFRFDQFKAATVRLKKDIDLLGRFGIDARYFPDIVFRACDLYEDIDMGVSLKNKKFSIGLNLTGQAGKKLGEELLSIANQLGLDLVFISSHLSDYNLHYEYTPNTLSDNISIYCYDSPSEMLRVLSGLDILISSKLHLGVSALSLGVPFISFNGKKKTRQFFLQHELSEYLIEASQQQAVVDIVKDAPKFLLENPYPHDRIAVLKEESLKHIDYLADFIKQHIH